MSLCFRPLRPAVLVAELQAHKIGPTGLREKDQIQVVKVDSAREGGPVGLSRLARGVRRNGVTVTTRVLILGAAGRDFHDFNVLYRDNPDFEVVGFTATQIPDISDRRYPASLAGSLYPEGLPIFEEADLESLIKEHQVDQVVFAYSDVRHTHVMHLAARANAAGAAFYLPADKTMIPSTLPVIAVTAVRTGAGKSPIGRKVRRIIADSGKRVGVVRHPMPYGELSRQGVQKFATYDDLLAANATIEEREEHEMYIDDGSAIWAGADYEAILRAAEEESDVIVWDGGNNDLPFFKPDLHICVVDPLRPGHELSYWPGEANLRRADVVVINKVDSADPEAVELVAQNVTDLNPGAVVIRAASRIWVDDPDAMVGKRALVIEDGPTLTHGEMSYGAGYLAAERFGATIIDPRLSAVGSLAAVFENFPHIGNVLPAMGYSDVQRKELAMSIRDAQPDVVVVGTPMNLANVIDIEVPVVRVYYEVEELTSPTLTDVVLEAIS